MQQLLETCKRAKLKTTKYGKIFSVYEFVSVSQLSGRKATFYEINCPDWVNIIPLTNTHKILLIKQYRHGSQEITLELPGGMVDVEENPEVAAKRELIEETGFVPEKIICLGKSRPNPAIQSNWIHHFCALNCIKTRATEFDEHESITTKIVSIDKISKLIENEEITHSLVLAAFAKLWMNERKLKEFIPNI
jgi:ADP-ribose pyrophosphatase YjhB (NUDIX family)